MFMETTNEITSMLGDEVRITDYQQGVTLH